MSCRFRRLAVPLLLLTGCCAQALADEPTQAPFTAPWLGIPLVLLLAAMAFGPFVGRRWWERSYPLIVLGLGAIALLGSAVIPEASGFVLSAGREYLGFIVYIGALSVVSGGILFTINGAATPLANTALMLAGALASNLLGSTGASLVFLRPFLRLNRERIRPYHVVFFIFIVGNIGGTLTPMGNPPLLLGYLIGVPLLWVTEHLWPMWGVAMGCILLIFYAIDRMHFARPASGVCHSQGMAEQRTGLKGIANIFFLLIIVIATLISRPQFAREVLMVLAGAGSWFMTSREIHRRNEFSWKPILEVGILFAGIFATMVPVRAWVEAAAAHETLPSAGEFYWATGGLSSVLDNAPTYLVMLTGAMGRFVSVETVSRLQALVLAHGAGVNMAPLEVQNAFHILTRYSGDILGSGSVPVHQLRVACLLGSEGSYVEAISVAAVFFGACTYIGNVPNMMVKTLAQKAGAPCPGFLGYIGFYAIPVLFPVFALIWLLFFKG